MLTRAALSFILPVIHAVVFQCAGQSGSDPKNADRTLQRCAETLRTALSPLTSVEMRAVNVAVIDVSHQSGGHATLVSYVQLELNKDLAGLSAKDQYRIYRLVEEEKIELVWKQQQLNCARSDHISEECIIKLGENLAADRIVSVVITDDPRGRKHWWRLYVTLRNARNAQVEYSFDEALYFKEDRTQERADEPWEEPKGIHGTWKDGFGLTLLGSYEQYFDTWHPSGAMDVGVNSGPVFIGLRLGFMPTVIDRLSLPFDIGHVVQLKPSVGSPDNEQIILVGNAPMGQNDMALISTGTVDLQWDRVENAADDGIEQFTFDRIRLTEVQAYRYSIHPFMRLYLGDRASERQRAKLFVDLGLGWDWVKAEAKYTVTRTSVRMNPDFTYTTDQVTTTPTTYDYAGYRSGLKLGTVLFGAGFEVSRFMISASWRTVLTRTFDEPYAEHRRIKGDIMLLPLLNAELESSNSVRTGLQTDQALVYGRSDIPASKEGGVSGNGVTRFVDRGNVVLSFGFRLF